MTILKVYWMALDLHGGVSKKKIIYLRLKLIALEIRILKNLYFWLFLHWKFHL